MREYLELNARILFSVFITPFGGRWFRLGETVRQLAIVAVRALPMVALTAFCVGFTRAMQSATELRKRGNFRARSGRGLDPTRARPGADCGQS